MPQDAFCLPVRCPDMGETAWLAGWPRLALGVKTIKQIELEHGPRVAAMEMLRRDMLVNSLVLVVCLEIFWTVVASFAR